MPTLDQIKAAYKKGGTYSAASRLLAKAGTPLSRDTVRRRLEKAEVKPVALPFTVANPKVHALDIVKLKLERFAKYQAKQQAYESTRVIRVNVGIDGPIGVGFMGDPHVDDDGTDLKLLFEHARIFDGRNEGMFAACIGDIWNNWIGKLSRLWAEQSTSAEEARALVTEFLQMIDWLLVLKGNHDMWSGSNDILDWLLEQNALVAKPTRAQIVLVFPNGREVEIYASHDFKGRSTWSTSHGPAKKAQLHQWGRIYVCGHLHDASYQHGFHNDGRMWHALRMASYKKLDEYVEQLDLEPKPGYECPVAIIDPYATSEINLIRFEFDPQEAADRLKWMRKRHAGSKLIVPKKPALITPKSRGR